MISDKYSDQLISWLRELGYTHCFFVAGGNIMHLLHSADAQMVCIPVVHEVTAGIAAEYFNQVNGRDGFKAFALVTAGPGLTNIVTAISGAYLESRELLVIGGQVKTSDLATGNLRQRGIQEIDGVSITAPVTKISKRFLAPLQKSEVLGVISEGIRPKQGPVFLEIPLDVQGSPVVEDSELVPQIFDSIRPSGVDEALIGIQNAQRPIILLGGGLSRRRTKLQYERLKALKIPVMTTWNGADLYGAYESNYWGRPNTWGQRYSNILIQQSDYLFAIGTRLGMQQTGFNWQEFVPNGQIVQVDIDQEELEKGHPIIDAGFCMDADDFLEELISVCEALQIDFDDWLKFGAEVKSLLPLSESGNQRKSGFINSYDFILELSKYIRDGDTIVPSSSGGAMTVTMQSLMQPRGSYVLTNKALASMGYGLAGAIGAAFATNSRIIHIEGDGGFSQNLQEIGTVAKQQLPIKMFIFCNRGYASIRTTQKSYFNGHYVGCDEDTGLGLPDWDLLFSAYGIHSIKLSPEAPFFDLDVQQWLENDLPCAFLVPIADDQTYFPKITSRITPEGGMESNPIHLMTPELEKEIADRVFRYL
jgi:acetolactate synthase-1/2/3 large subunit